MNIELREDSVLITGYVNAVERLSKPIRESIGGKIRTFLERIKAGVFRTALKRNDNVLVLLNHNPERVLANTKDGSAQLEEDNIGLRAEINITDKEVVEKAREGKLSGWSFGFYSNSDEITTEGKNEVRNVTDLDLVEVSILDDTKEPAYYGTSIESRGGEKMKLEIRADAFEEPKEEEPMKEEPTKETKAEETINIDELANKIAEIIIAKINAKEKAEDLAEDKVEEQIAKDLEEKPMEEKECGEDDKENRDFDYSAFEQRLSKLSK